VGPSRVDHRRDLEVARLQRAHSDTIGKFLSDFNASQDQYYAQVLYINGYDEVNTKLTAALQAKKVPDIVGLGSGQWWTFMLNQMLEPLESHFTGNFTADAFYDVFLSEGQVNKKTYWVPYGRSTPMCYYNRDVFSKAGLPDRAPKTWTEFRSWGESLKGMTANGQALKLTPFAMTDNGWLFNNPAWSFGGYYGQDLTVTLDSPEIVKAAQFEFDMINTDKTSYGSQTAGADFTSGLAAVNMGSTAGLTSTIKTAKFEVGTGFMPGEDKDVVPTGGGGMAMLRYISDERKAGAAKVLDFLYDAQRVADFSVASGYIPCTTAATQTTTIQDLWKKDVRYKTASDQLKYAQFQDLLTRIMPALAQDMASSLQKLYSDASASPSDIFKALATQVNQQLPPVKTAYDKVINGQS